jgi:hypothetical protein
MPQDAQFWSMIELARQPWEDMNVGSCKHARMTSRPNELRDGNRSNADELADYSQLDFGVPRRRDPEQCLCDRDGDDLQETSGLSSGSQKILTMLLTAQ